MRLDDEQESSNYEVRSGGGGGGFGGIPLGRGGLGCGSLVVILILSWVMGVNPLQLIGAVGGGSSVEQPQIQTQPGSGGSELSETQRRSLKILGSTERVWGDIFKREGSNYAPTTLVFYQGGTQAGCGFADAAVGPFYCPTDTRIYLDTAFFDELASKFGAPGDFAQAYVIAHEVGHHVQDLTGVLAKARRMQSGVSEAQANAVQVKVELQADCYAGVWAANDKNLLEAGDAEAGLRAAAAVGDDTLQRQAQGQVVPEGFTHGSAADRQKWLEVGLSTGDPAKCDTFR